MLFWAGAKLDFPGYGWAPRSLLARAVRGRCAGCGRAVADERGALGALGGFVVVALSETMEAETDCVAVLEREAWSRRASGAPRALVEGWRWG